MVNRISQLIFTLSIIFALVFTLFVIVTPSVVDARYARDVVRSGKHQSRSNNNSSVGSQGSGSGWGSSLFSSNVSTASTFSTNYNNSTGSSWGKTYTGAGSVYKSSSNYTGHRLNSNFKAGNIQNLNTSRLDKRSSSSLNNNTSSNNKSSWFSIVSRGGSTPDSSNNGVSLSKGNSTVHTSQSTHTVTPTVHNKRVVIYVRDKDGNVVREVVVQINCPNGFTRLVDQYGRTIPGSRHKTTCRDLGTCPAPDPKDPSSPPDSLVPVNTNVSCVVTKCQSPLPNVCGEYGEGEISQCSDPNYGHTCDALQPPDPSGTCSVQTSCGIATGVRGCNNTCIITRYPYCPLPSENTNNNTIWLTLPNSGQAGEITAKIYAKPILVKNATKTKIVWLSAWAESCVVSGSNGDSGVGWSGVFGEHLSSDIVSETTYTVTCKNKAGATATDSVKVRLLPEWQEI